MLGNYKGEREMERGGGGRGRRRGRGRVRGKWEVREGTSAERVEEREKGKSQSPPCLHFIY